MVALPEVRLLSVSLASVWRLRAMALARSASNRASAASPIINVSLFLNLKQYVSQIEGLEGMTTWFHVVQGYACNVSLEITWPMLLLTCLAPWVTSITIHDLAGPRSVMTRITDTEVRRNRNSTKVQRKAVSGPVTQSSAARLRNLEQKASSSPSTSRGKLVSRELVFRMMKVETDR